MSTYYAMLNWPLPYVRLTNTCIAGPHNEIRIPFEDLDDAIAALEQAREFTVKESK